LNDHARPVRKVAVIGAECVGKSTLCRALAPALPALWVQETVREFCVERHRNPHADEQRPLLELQIEREAAAVAEATRIGLGWVLCDSAPIVIALCSVHYFGDRSLLAPARAHQATYAATLLLEPDLDWVADGFLRDGPEVRDRFHGALATLLAAWSIAVEPICGAGGERTANALTALRAIGDNPLAR
jgi:nicotinamide riboside kinase